MRPPRKPDPPRRKVDNDLVRIVERLTERVLDLEALVREHVIDQGKKK